jgi:type II secretory pathway pseudopilin PulG
MGINKKINKSIRGFSLPEVLVSLISFTLLTLMVMNSLMLGITFIKRAEKKGTDTIVCRAALDIMIDDIRLAVPNLDIGEVNSPTGFRKIDPPLPSTAILMPNQNSGQTNTTYIEFTKPNYDIANAVPGTFDRWKPEMFRVIKYYCTGATLFREVTTISAAGVLSSPVATPIAEVDNGTIELQVRSICPRSAELKLTIKKIEDGQSVTTCSYNSVVTVAVQ